MFLSCIKNWILLSRAPFLSVGLLPFIAGTMLARRSGYQFNAPVFWWGFAAVTMVMLVTYFNGEIFDIVEDSIGAKTGKSVFSGGSQVLVESRESPALVNKVSWYMLIIILLIGCLLQFGYRRGSLTLLLGVTGIITGFFYSRPPFRWVKRGIGELFIGYSYGWLPITVGFYLQSGRLDPRINLICLPIAFSIFNVIFINEYLDHEADKQAVKRNLLVRIGREKGVYVYMAAALFSAFTAMVFLYRWAPSVGFMIAFFAACAACICAILMLTRQYRLRRRLELICGLTILTNLLYSISYIVTFLQT